MRLESTHSNQSRSRRAQRTLGRARPMHCAMELRLGANDSVGMFNRAEEGITKVDGSTVNFAKCYFCAAHTRMVSPTPNGPALLCCDCGCGSRECD